MGLILVPQAVQDGHRILGRRLTDCHRLEAALQGSILFDVLTVLIEGSGTHHADLAAAQSGLDDVGRIHGALGIAGTHNGVQLIDEEDDLAVLLHLIEHILDALLEFTAVLGAGHHAAQIQRQDAAVQQVLRHIGRSDALGQTFGDGGLADTGLTDQNRVVLGAAGEDLDDTGNLLVTADHRIQLSLAGSLRQVAGILLQCLFLLSIFTGGCISGAGTDGLGNLLQLLDNAAVELPLVNAHGTQDAQSHVVAFADDAHQQMFCADIAGTAAGRLTHSQFHHALGTGRQALTWRHTGRTRADAALQDGADHIIGQAELLQDPVGNALLFPQEPQKQMLRSHVAVTHLLGGFLT